MKYDKSERQWLQEKLTFKYVEPAKLILLSTLTIILIYSCTGGDWVHKATDFIMFTQTSVMIMKLILCYECLFRVINNAITVTLVVIILLTCMTCAKSTNSRIPPKCDLLEIDFPKCDYQKQISQNVNLLEIDFPKCKFTRNRFPKM